MTQTRVSSLILKLGIPTTISMLITSIYNMADTFVVGMLGEDTATGAVGVGFKGGLIAVMVFIGILAILCIRGEKNAKDERVEIRKG